jgi:predicted negative regulator of RcsB-dependent stress response
MNPQAVAAIAAAVPRPSSSTTNTLLKIGVVGVGVYLGYKWYKKQQENKANAQDNENLHIVDRTKLIQQITEIRKTIGDK